MGGEETQEGPFYNSDTLDDGRIVAPGYVNCLICICMNKKRKQNKTKNESKNNKKTFYFIILIKNIILLLRRFSEKLLAFKIDYSL